MGRIGIRDTKLKKGVSMHFVARAGAGKRKERGGGEVGKGNEGR